MKKTNTKKALGMSLISLLACGVMFAGSTYAWFTDEVVASGNKIESGTLKADMEVLKDDEWVSIKENPETKIFDYDKWEPGYSASTTLRILNKGNLGFRYQVLGEFAGQTYGPNGESLADVIDVYMYAADIKDPFEIPTMTDFASIKAEAEANVSNTRAEGWYKVGTLDFWMNLPYGLTAGYMLPKGAEYDGTMYGYNGVCETGYPATVVLHMQEEAGNEYQGLTLGDINLTLKATQWAWEKDGFGNSNYDDAATIKNEAQLIAALKKGGTIELGAPVALDEVVEISADTVINLNGYDLDTSACARRPFQMANGADLTINATNSEVKAGNYGLVYIPDGESKVVLNGGSYTSNMDNGSFIKPKGTAKVEVELNNVKFADASDDSYIMDASSYSGNELVVTINGGDYSCAKGINGHNADFTVKGATIETSLFSFEAGAGSTLLIEDSEISVLTNTENPAAPSACVALSDTTGTNPSSATVKNSVLNSKYHVFANYSGHNTLTYTDCEINHSGDAALFEVYDHPVGSSLVINGVEVTTVATVDTAASLVDALADSSIDYVVLASDVDFGDLGTNPTAVAVKSEKVLDLNGHTVEATTAYNKNSQLVHVSGDGVLTIEDSVGTGALNYTYTGADVTPGAFLATVVCVADGGTLVVNGGTLANLSTAAGVVKTAIDILNNTSATVVINDGTIVCEEYWGIRMFANSSTGLNSLTINGGKVIGGYCAVRIQEPSANKFNPAVLKVAGGELVGNYAVSIWCATQVSPSPEITLDFAGSALTLADVQNAEYYISHINLI